MIYSKEVRNLDTVNSFGIDVRSMSQIIVFHSDVETYKKILSANPQMVDLTGSDGKFQKEFQDTFIAGIARNQWKDSGECPSHAIQK